MVSHLWFQQVSLTEILTLSFVVIFSPAQTPLHYMHSPLACPHCKGCGLRDYGLFPSTDIAATVCFSLLERTKKHNSRLTGAMQAHCRAKWSPFRTPNSNSNSNSNLTIILSGLMDDNYVFKFLILPTCSMNPETAVTMHLWSFQPSILCQGFSMTLLTGFIYQQFIYCS